MRKGIIILLLLIPVMANAETITFFPVAGVITYDPITIHQPSDGEMDSPPMTLSFNGDKVRVTKGNEYIMSGHYVKQENTYYIYNDDELYIKLILLEDNLGYISQDNMLAIIGRIVVE